MIEFGDIIILLITLGVGFAAGRISGRRGAPPPDPHEAARTAAQMRTEDRLAVSALVKEGRKIEAIKETRERLRCGLAEAKAVVDHLEASDPATGIG
ncbi:MAG: hypothetical protein WA906_00495 [Pacificimonas sp.]